MIKARNNKVVVVIMEQKVRNNEVPGTSPQRCSRSSARARAEALEERNGKRREDQRAAGKNLPPKE